jgi:hypothetical protein
LPGEEFLNVRLALLTVLLPQGPQHAIPRNRSEVAFAEFLTFPLKRKVNRDQRIDQRLKREPSSIRLCPAQRLLDSRIGTTQH